MEEEVWFGEHHDSITSQTMNNDSHTATRLFPEEEEEESLADEISTAMQETVITESSSSALNDNQIFKGWGNPDFEVINLPEEKEEKEEEKTNYKEQLHRKVDKASFFTIEVINPEVQGEGVSAYVSYTVNTKTTLDLYQKNELSVKRRFSDFIWLQEQLIHNHKGIVIAPLPDKALLQTNKISGNRFEENFIEYRRRELQRFLTRVCEHPTLCTSKYLQLFLESENSAALVSDQKEEEKQTTNSGKFFSFFNKQKPPSPSSAQEIDPWFSDRSTYLHHFKHRLESLATTASALVHYHFEGINVYANFTESCKMVENCEKEVSPILSQSFNRLSEISSQVQLLQHELGDSSSKDFVDILRDYIRMVGHVQRVLDYRLEKLADYQNAIKDLEQKKQKAQSKPDDAKLLSFVESQNQKVDEAKEIFDSVSDLVKSEIERFENTKAQEIHFAVIQFAQFNMNRELCMLDQWKKFINDLQ